MAAPLWLTPDWNKVGLSDQSRRDIGRQAEDMAREFLDKKGLKLIERNYRSPRGEIDLVMRDQDTTVFVEVRFRSSTRFGSGAESVDRNKRARLIATSLHYLQAHPKLAKQPARFDVISITSATTQPEVEWIKDAIEA